MSYPVNQTVTEVGQINFTGNITPPTWYAHLKYQNGLPQTNAITILAEIVYWYRPRIIRDEATGGILRVEKRFKADKLQRSYQSFVAQFGFTKKQVRDAVGFLVDFGVITKELRDITITDGTPLHNVLYLEVVPAKLKEINQVTPSALQVTPSALQVIPSALQVTPSIPVGQTNTETPTKTPTEKEDDFENSPTTEKQPPTLDLLTNIVQTAKNGTSEQTGPNPDDQWWGPRDKTLKLHARFNGGKLPGEAHKQKLVSLAEQPTFNLEILENSYIEAGTNWTGNSEYPPLARVIEVYEAGGDYEKFAARKWPDKEITNVTTASKLTPAQKAAARQRDAEMHG